MWQLPKQSLVSVEAWVWSQVFKFRSEQYAPKTPAMQDMGGLEQATEGKAWSWPSRSAQRRVIGRLWWTDGTIPSTAMARFTVMVRKTACVLQNWGQWPVMQLTMSVVDRDHVLWQRKSWRREKRSCCSSSLLLPVRQQARTWRWNGVTNRWWAEQKQRTQEMSSGTHENAKKLTLKSSKGKAKQTGQTSAPILPWLEAEKEAGWTSWFSCPSLSERVLHERVNEDKRARFLTAYECTRFTQFARAILTILCGHLLLMTVIKTRVLTPKKQALLEVCGCCSVCDSRS